MKPSERKKQIDRILKNFQFTKVHVAMVALDWTWATTGKTPTIRQLKQTARRLLKQLKPGSNLLSGGFEAYWDRPGCLGLKFVIDYWYEE